MSRELHKRQMQLMSYLRGQEAGDEISEHIVVQGNVSTDTRLGIYRNAYQVRLRETIDVDHPVIGTYLGDELFNTMVTDYCTQFPSQEKSLRQFADRLPHFLATRSPFQEHPQVSELARFERLLMTAFDAADAERLPASYLSSIPETQWSGLNILLHPSVLLFKTDWNVVEIWQAIKSEHTPPNPQQAASYWLVWRNHKLLTEFRSIEATELALIQSIIDGKNFTELYEYLMDFYPESEIAEVLINNLSRWLEQGLIASMA